MTHRVGPWTWVLPAAAALVVTASCGDAAPEKQGAAQNGAAVAGAPVPYLSESGPSHVVHGLIQCCARRRTFADGRRMHFVCIKFALQHSNFRAEDAARLVAFARNVKTRKADLGVQASAASASFVFRMPDEDGADHHFSVSIPGDAWKLDEVIDLPQLIPALEASLADLEAIKANTPRVPW